MAAVIIAAGAILARTHGDTHVRTKRDITAEITRDWPRDKWITVRFKDRDYEAYRADTRLA